VGCFEHGNELSGSIEGWKFTECQGCYKGSQGQTKRAEVL